MKRVFTLLLLSLFIFTAAFAVAETKSHKKKKHAKPAPEIELQADPGLAIAKRAQIKKERKATAGTLDNDDDNLIGGKGGPGIRIGKPIELTLRRADSRRFDVRLLPQVPIEKVERPEREEPEISPTILSTGTTLPPQIERPSLPSPSAPAPGPIMNFDGLDFATWGNGHPPDTVGDVGPQYYIQAINTSLGIFQKSDGVRVAAFTFNTFMHQGNFGNLCDTNNFGDPVILYDTFEDRWIITDFAFQLGSVPVANSVVNPPGAFQCFAVSMNGDPVNGGWNFYSINTPLGLGDYPKFGIWPDGLYMGANMFGYPGGAPFQNARAYAFNKMQMYAGAPSVQVASFDILGNGDFTVIPANARLQTGAPPLNSPNYYTSVSLFTNAALVYKFHVDWTSIGNSTFGQPDFPQTLTPFPSSLPGTVPSQGGNNLDTLAGRTMMQVQYTNIGGAESLWTSHTVRRATGGTAAPRWYQFDVTGGNVNPNMLQNSTWDPDAANTMNRFIPSVAVDRGGDMAIGYSTSNSTTKPAIKYAGRLAGDTLNTLGQTEQVLIQGTGTQTGNCGGAPCTRWGDYAAMTIDPVDGCTFWFTTMYYAVDGLNHLTRIGSFQLPGCIAVGAGGTLSGTVTATAGGAPIPGATVRFGSRTATTDGSGFYSFTPIPAGTYPGINAGKPGFLGAAASSIVITGGNTTTQNFSLGSAPTSACLTDTTQGDLQTGVATNIDLNATPGSAQLVNADPQNLFVNATGVGATTTTWAGQTFTPLASGNLTKIDLLMFCSGCSGTNPNLTVSIRATSGNLPTGADLATATIPGFTSGNIITYTANFTPFALTGGTTYAFMVRPVSTPTGTYALMRSGTDTYPGGQRVQGATSGTVWSAPLTGSITTDAGFRVYMSVPQVPASGNFVSAVKDANPSGGITSIWSTLSWNATTPANTSVKFQVAGSNSAGGPFNFIGPDGTAGTFFTTSPASLSQFYNFRYLQYKAFFTSSDNLGNPSLDDVTLCFSDVDCSGTITITPTPAQVCANSTGNTASGPAGETSYAWSIVNGTITSATNTQSITYTAGASGNVQLLLSIVEPGGCQKSNSVMIPINPIPPVPTITPGGPTTFTYPGNVTLNSSSGSGNQWYRNGGSLGGETNPSYLASLPGNYTVEVTLLGCPSGQSSITTVTVNQATPVVTATGGTFAYNGTPRPGSGSATGGAGETLAFTLTYTGTGATTYGPSTTAPTLVGTYNVVAHTDGDANNTANDSAPAALTITKANPTVGATGGTFTYDGNPKAGSGNATGGGGESLSVTLTYAGTGSTTYGPSATAPSLAGTYTVTAHTTGDANNNSGDSSATALTINKFDPLMSAHGGTLTYDGLPHAGTGQAIGGAGEALPVTLTYQGISGTTYGPSPTPPTNSGVYLVTAHTVGDANNNAKDSLPNALRINKATPTIVVTPYCVAFDGSPHTATGTATGAQGEALAGLVLTGTTHTAAGTYATDPWTFSDATGNYNAANNSVSDTIVTAAITASASAVTGSTGNVASVASAGAGATYNWGITNGTITGGTGTNSITFTAGAIGTLTLNLTVTVPAGCSDTKSANVAVTPPPPSISSIVPPNGPYFGTTPITVNGANFVSGATITLGGTAATNVVFVNSTKLTAKTAAHAGGTVNVVVTNPDAQSGTLVNGYTYRPRQFDANGDNTVDPSDIFFLISYLFMNGQAPHGAAGLMSGDANGDGMIDPSDIFYLVNFLFTGGQQPYSEKPGATTMSRANVDDASIGGTIALGRATRRGDRVVIPVTITRAPGSITPYAMSLNLRFSGDASGVVVHHAGATKGLQPSFEATRRTSEGVAYLVTYDEHATKLSIGGAATVVAEIELTASDAMRIDVDPALTMLSDQGGMHNATVANGGLRVSGTSVGAQLDKTQEHKQ